MPDAKPGSVASLIQQRTEHVSNSSLLAAAGGFLDAYTYIGHGHIFANAQTGNVVLLGVELLSPERAESLRHLPPILMFLLGIWAARAFEHWYGYATHHLRLARSAFFPDRYETILAIECLILLPLAFAPAATRDLWITAPIAFAASLQVQTFRSVAGYTYNSTFTTGNLRSLAVGLFDWMLSEPGPGGASKAREGRVSAGIFAQICLAFFLGALAGGLLTPRVGNRALLAELILIVLVMIRLRLPLSPSTASEGEG